MQILLALLFTSFGGVICNETIYKADMPINDTLYQRFPFRNINLNYGTISLENVSQQIVPQSRSIFDNQITQLLEEARKYFEVGFPSKGIPPLDPLYIDSFRTNLYDIWVINADLIFTNIKIVGLKNFIINSLNFSIGELKLMFDFTVPELSINCLYKFQGIVSSVIPFYPKGDGWFDLQGCRIKGLAKLTLEDDKLFLDAFKLDLNANQIIVHLSGLLGNGHINKLVNGVLSQISNLVIQNKKEELSKAATEYLKNEINRLLKGVTLEDLFYLTG